MKEKGKRCHFDAVEEVVFLLLGCPIVYMSPLKNHIQILNGRSEDQAMDKTTAHSHP